jgi:hypothetical protein
MRGTVTNGSNEYILLISRTSKTHSAVTMVFGG